MRKKLAILGIVLLFFGVVRAISVSEDPYFFLSLGDFLIKNGYEKQALMAYEKALGLDPQNKIVLNNLGYYYREKNPLMSEEYFLKALEIDPDYETARSNLALLYNKLKMYEKAIEHLRILLKKNPDNINYNYDIAINLANNFYYNGYNYNNLLEAIEHFKKVYSMNPNFEHTLENIKVLEEIRRTMENK